MNQKIGQQGAVIARDYESAIEHVQNLYRMTIRHLNDEEFAHFYYLSNYRKEQILAPLKELLSCRNLHFRKTKDSTPYGNHYDFYLGQIDEFNTPCGTGLYGWEWEKDEDGDTSINYFVGEFKDDDFTDNGVRYHYSSEDAKIYFDVKGSFCVYAAKGVGEYRNAHSHIYSAREVDRRNEARKEEKRRRAIEKQEAERRQAIARQEAERRAREEAERKRIEAERKAREAAENKRLEEKRIQRLEEQERICREEIGKNRSYYLNEAELVYFSEVDHIKQVRYGFKDAKSGKIVIPAKYSRFSSIRNWSSGERTADYRIINKVGETKTIPANVFVKDNGDVVYTPYDKILESEEGEGLFIKGGKLGFFNQETMQEIPVHESAAAKAYLAQRRKKLGKFLLSVLVALSPLIGTILFFDSPISIITLWPELAWWWIVLYILVGGFLMLLTFGLPATIWEDNNHGDFTQDVPWYGLLITACYWLTKAMIAIYPNLGSTWSWIGMVVCTAANLTGIIFLIKGLVWIHDKIKLPYKFYNN